MIAGILCGAGTVGSYLADELIVTDREQVTVSVHALADDVKRLDLNNTLRHISPRQVELKSMVKGGFDVITEIEYLTISDLHVSVFGEGNRARSHFRANGGIHVKGYGDVGHKPTRWELTWQKEGTEWKIIEIQRLNPITGEVIGTLTQHQ